MHRRGRHGRAVRDRERAVITIWTVSGSALHCELTDAFLGLDGYVIVRGALHQVLTMETPAHLDRTCWRLVAVAVSARA